MPRHATSGSFKPGQINNPRGRPKALADIQALARKQTAANIAVMVELRDTCEDSGIRLRAAIALHEIGWGKPVQAVAGVDGGAIQVTWLPTT